MFIALEGADGSGKTTLCAVLAEKLGAMPYATPPKKYLALREGVDKDASPEEHYRFYRDGIYDASCEIEMILTDGGKIVADRYWLTTYTYHQVMGVQIATDDFRSVIMPTLTVILSLGKDTQIRRMLHRGMSIGDRKMLDKQKGLALAFYQNALEFEIPFIMIDTRRFLPKACAEIVIRALEF